jgi:hypothetical protein
MTSKNEQEELKAKIKLLKNTPGNKLAAGGSNGVD